jgi:ATP-dependent protease HslVU (ClpYQ) peptidase subunit
VEYNLDLPEDSYQVAGEYLGSAFIPALRACLKEHGGLKDEQMEAVIMVGYKGGLFIIGEDFTLSEIATSCEAIGAGAKYALGYLYAMEKTCLSPERLIEGALGCAEYWCAGVRGPFIIEELA